MIELRQYRDPWMAEGVYEHIGFYPREFYCLDNFSAFGIVYDDGVYYQTVEHCYQSLSFKGSDDDIAEAIKDIHSAHDAKQMAITHMNKRRLDWNNIKVDVMVDLLRLKMRQHPYVVKKLLQTRDYLIVEDSPYDSFWGIGPDGSGENHLGRIWMRLRDECSPV